MIENRYNRTNTILNHIKFYFMWTFRYANIVNNIAVMSSASRQTKRWWTAEWCRTVILSEGIFKSHETAIVNSFSCIFLHSLINTYACVTWSILRWKYLYFRAMNFPFVSKLRRRWWDILRKWPTLSHPLCKTTVPSTSQVPEIPFAYAIKLINV